MPLRPEAWPRAREVFEQALALPAAERSRYVEDACGSDRSLRDEIERMLASHGLNAGFLSTPPAAPVHGVSDVLSLEGRQIGPYTVSSRIGAGGMGEVYRAHDSRLKRDVALKVLPAFLAGDPDRLARFEREAQALAALNHPNIAAIHGFEVSGDVRALVLELVDGETLADRLAHGAVPVGEALGVARQIALALEAAHEQGIIHRDLKPANIKITSNGVVKVLDFGLAKLVGPEGSAANALSPTMTSPALLTGAGMLLGTAAYMSPEQARGRVADKRADIWAFGVVLYEMLTGRRAFPGDTVTETLAAVIHKDLDWTRIPKDLSPAVLVALRACLRKDPTDRLRDMGDVRLALDGAFTPDAPVRIGPAFGRWSVAVIAAAMILAAVAGGAGVWWYSSAEPPVRQAVRVDISPPVRDVFSPSISPDGRSLFFQARDASAASRPYVYSLETARTRPLATGFDGAAAWSPDSRWLVFVSGGKLRKIDVEADGPGVPICDVVAHDGLAWPSPNTILFADSSTGAIMQVSADGGTAVPRTKVDANGGESRHTRPQALPGGRHFLYVRRSKVPENDGIFVGDVDVGPEAQELRRLAPFVQAYLFAPSIGSGPGHLLFERAGVLLAQAFDEKRRVLSGDAVPVVELAPNTQFSVSATGIIAFTRRWSQFGSLVWVGRDGNHKGVIAGRLRGLENPRLSNDERKIAVIVAGDVWRYDLDGRPPSKLTFDGSHLTPLWTRDDTRVVYETRPGLASVPADGGGGAPEPASPTGHFHPHAWSPDGREIVAERWLGEPGNYQRDLVRLQPRAGGQLETLVATPASEGRAASTSPNGQWLAYTSDSLGQEEVFVMLLSQPGAAVRVSPNGGGEPVWARTGRELFYLEGSSMMSVAVQTGVTFSFSPPTRLFDAAPYRRSEQPPSYDVAADGRFVMVRPDLESTSEAPITVIVNWSELLRRRALAR